MRVSDAERAEVADRLAEHYSQGRLDQAAFDERLDRAMKAKTQSDLSGLLADLPGAGAPGGGAPVPGAPEGPPPKPHRHRGGRRVLFLLLVAVAAAIVGESLARSFISWLLLVLLAFLWLRYGTRHHRRL